MATANPTVVRIVRTGRCKTFLAIKELKRTDRSL
jgi:hypothetical protein